MCTCMVLQATLTHTFKQPLLFEYFSRVGPHITYRNKKRSKMDEHANQALCRSPWESMGGHVCAGLWTDFGGGPSVARALTRAEAGLKHGQSMLAGPASAWERAPYWIRVFVLSAQLDESTALHGMFGRAARGRPPWNRPSLLRPGRARRTRRGWGPCPGAELRG